MAAEYRLANGLVESFAQFKQHYNLENDPTLVEPGWADQFVRFLRSTQIAVLLLVVGGLGLYIELHSPGLGLGGFVAMVCFALFFWSRYLDGTAGWLQVTLFITGVACLLLEVLLTPGFGIFALGGGILILASFVLASQSSWLPRNEYQMAQLEHSLMTVATAVGGQFLPYFYFSAGSHTPPSCGMFFSSRPRAKRRRLSAAARCSSTWRTCLERSAWPRPR